MLSDATRLGSGILIRSPATGRGTIATDYSHPEAGSQTSRDDVCFETRRSIHSCPPRRAGMTRRLQRRQLRPLRLVFFGGAWISCGGSNCADPDATLFRPHARLGVAMKKARRSGTTTPSHRPSGAATTVPPRNYLEPRSDPTKNASSGAARMVRMTLHFRDRNDIEGSPSIDCLCIECVADKLATGAMNHPTLKGRRQRPDRRLQRVVP